MVEEAVCIDIRSNALSSEDLRAGATGVQLV